MKVERAHCIAYMTILLLVVGGQASTLILTVLGKKINARNSKYLTINKKYSKHPQPLDLFCFLKLYPPIHCYIPKQHNISFSRRKPTWAAP
jgi:hypothetical protein